MTEVSAERLRQMSDDDLRRLAAEVKRLQDAKRRALAVADELAKENVELRAEIAQLQKEAREAGMTNFDSKTEAR